jgi:hypothetical protein
MSDEKQIREAAKDLVDPKHAGDGPSEKELEPTPQGHVPPVEEPDRPREGGGGGNSGGG